ncbi:hypothetical protein LX15_001088 [Streptoalloteichus tenebrarius]|uniref:Amidohydrolase-related domain-containing protein n=1 Tax=Streptoalloteichus tenebrarius (strain ATCC 17920 / DSM 40477 / JCM 4838 / CBS 697.72 / NBRC 16177 / NCIMB 11028 / NRRL B-12390 / A12253. 1 / ISP 5477) TaxID=1933 RepID=A0ABT1HPF9_STRSD|nr:hypothetical protein [Streptoalloteichus tenebrarius]MCP2257403.1 hypothetical protein [Streptoalloteichus tenebrarius]BFE98350.1 hypothetical protein GCM10020241_00260 [Streptoalloteichus tenebrarius]
MDDAVVAPALRDAHVHPYSGMDFAALIAFGVARVRDLGSRLGAGEPLPRPADCADPLPEIELGGPFFDRPGPPRLSLAARWDSAEELPGLLDDAVTRGARWIKLYAAFPQELFGFMVREAHRRGLRVALHPAPGGAEAAIRAGVDELEHLACLVPDGDGSKRGTHVLNHRWAHRDPDARWPNLPPGTRLCPTLVVQRKLIEHAASAWAFPGVPGNLAAFWRRMPTTARPWSEQEIAWARAAEPRMHETLLRLADSGVTLVVGSDTPNPGVLPGQGLWEEMCLLVRAGIDPALVFWSTCVRPPAWPASGDDPLMFLSLPSVRSFLAGEPGPVAPVLATLLRGCVFVPNGAGVSESVSQEAR